MFTLSPVAAILLYIIVGSGLAAYVGKRVADKEQRTELFLWQYVFTFIIAVLFAFATGESVLDASFANVVLIGFVAGGGTFFAWKAIRVSQSRNALHSFWSTIIAMTLSFFILHEGQFITLPIGIGIVMSVVAGLGCMWRSHQRESLSFYGYVAAYSGAWGLAMFGQRFWSFHGMPIPTFLLGWYTGTLIAAFVFFIFCTNFSKDRQNTAPLRLKDIVLVFVLAVLTILSLGLASVSYRLPQMIVLPIFFIAGMVLPALIGLFVFHEREQLALVDWLLFGLGAFGALIVGLNLII